MEIAIYWSLGIAKETEPAIVAGKKSLKVGMEWWEIGFLNLSWTDISKGISLTYHYYWQTERLSQKSLAV